MKGYVPPLPKINKVSTVIKYVKQKTPILLGGKKDGQNEQK